MIRVQAGAGGPMRVDAKEIGEGSLYLLARKTDSFAQEVKHMNQQLESLKKRSDVIDRIPTFGVGGVLVVQCTALLEEIAELTAHSEEIKARRGVLKKEYIACIRDSTVDTATLHIAQQIHEDLNTLDECEEHDGRWDCTQFYCPRKVSSGEEYAHCIMGIMCLPCLPFTICCNKVFCGGKQIDALRVKVIKQSKRS